MNNEALTFSPSIRALIPKILLIITLSLFIRVAENLKLASTYVQITGTVTVTAVHLRKFENYLVSYDKINKGFFFKFYLSCALASAYLFMDLMTTSFTIDRLNIRYEHGLLWRISDSIDISKIIDHSITRSPIDLLLGLRTIVIDSKDVSTPKLKINGLSEDLADEIYELIKLNSNTSAAEYMRSRLIETERDKDREKPEKNKK